MKNASLLLVSLLFIPLLAAGETLDVGNSLNLNLTPEIPKANELVNARLESYATNLDRSEIVWILNGKEEERGTGKTKFSFMTGALGSETTLSVSVKTLDGSFLNRVLHIRPALVSLVWQAYSYTPPFYRGKTLLPIEGTASLIALPSFITASGERIPPEEIIYTWRENDRVSGDGSGYGKFSFPVKSRIPIRPITVSVEAAAPEAGLVATAETTISPVAPQMLLYEERPLAGVSIRAALPQTFAFDGDEMRITAMPYFFETPSRASTLTYAWSVNNSPSRETGSSITLRRSSTDNGRAQLALSITSPKSIFQAAEALATVLIGTQ